MYVEIYDLNLVKIFYWKIYM